MTATNDSLLDLVLEEWSDAGVLCWDRAGRLLTVSPGFGHLTGIADASRMEDIGALWTRLRAGCQVDPGSLETAFAAGDLLEVTVLVPGAPTPRRLRLTRRRLDDRQVLLLRAVSGPDAAPPRHDQEHQLRSLINAAPVGIGTLKDRCFQTVNPLFCRQLGYGSDELIGRSARMIYFSDEEFERVGREKYAMLRAHGLGEIETRLRCKDGSAMEVLIRSSWLDNAHPEAGTTFTVLDITQRKQAQRRLAEEEERFRQLAENIREVFWLVDWPEFRVVYVSPGVERIWQLPAEAFYADPRQWVLSVHPDDCDLLERSLRDTAAGRPFDLEYRILRPDGEQRVIHDRGFPVFDAAGRVYRIAGFAADVTDRVEIQATLAASESRYRLLAENMLDMVSVHDLDGIYRYVSPSCLPILGYTEQELIGHSAYEFLHPDDVAAVRKSHDTILDGKSTCRVDYRIRRKHGDFVWVETLSHVYRDANGAAGILAQSREVTDRRRAELGLAESEARYRRIVETAMEGIWIIDEQALTTFVNAHMAAMLGYPRDAMHGRSLFEFMDPEAERQARALFAERRTGKAAIHEFRFRHHSGAEVWALVSTTAIEADDGGFQGAFAMVTDISALKAGEFSLRESERKYRLLFEKIPQGVVIQNASLDITDCNPAAQRILGRSRDEILGLNSHSVDWRCIDEDGSEMPVEVHPVARALRDGVAVKTMVMGVFNPQTNDHVWISVEAVPLFMAGAARPSGVFSSFTDITESRQLQQALQHSQKLEAVGRLTGGIAHDFNNILGSVLGFAELARLRNAARDPKMTGYLGQIETAGLRARDLVRQLLIYSRGERSGEVGAVSVIPMLKEIVKLLRPSLPAGIDIRLDLAESVPPIRIDVLHLQQMVMNLCLNARDAMPDGGILRLSVHLAQFSGQSCLVCRKPVHGEWVEVAVSDDGCGVSAEHRDLLCQPFFTTKAVGEGSGMGLSVVEGLLRTHGGHLLLDSVLGDGTRFRLLFAPIESEPAAIDACGPETNSRYDITGRRVLVAEDEPAIQAYYREILALAGAEAVVSDDGVSALETLLAGPAGFDLLLVDLGMPGMGGLELLKQVRALKLHIPAIVCSGNDETLSQELIARLRIDAVMLKPVRQDELLGGIQRLLRAKPTA